MHISRWALTLAVLSSLAGAPANAGDGSGQVLVVTHLDIIPTFVPQAQPLIEQFVVDSRGDAGVKSFIVITWTPTTNHFQLIERFVNKQAFDAHVSLPHTVKFRDDLQGFIGAPYDERLYSASRQ
jgi:quinol monooxygenase YgiN